MAFPAMRDVNRVPLNELFPESYEASKRETARDFVLFGAVIAASVIAAAALNLWIESQL